MNFKLGDIVKGNKKAAQYLQTRPDTYWVVLGTKIDVYGDEEIIVAREKEIPHYILHAIHFNGVFSMKSLLDFGFSVNPECFDFAGKININKIFSSSLLEKLMEED